MSTPTLTDSTVTLRRFTTALGILRSYEAEVPERMTEAHARLREARIVAVEYAVPPLVVHADEAFDASDLRRGVAAAAKERAAARERAEIASALYPAAVGRAVRALIESREEIVDAVLGSDVLARAFEDVQRLAPLVDPSMVATPDAERHGLDAVANVAMLRRASDTFPEALARLASVGVLPGYEPKYAPLAYALTTGTADRNAVDRALRGVRPGALDLAVWTMPQGFATGVLTPYNEPGVEAAILYSTPCVLLDQATTAQEFEARVSAQESGVVEDLLPLSIIE